MAFLEELPNRVPAGVVRLTAQFSLALSFLVVVMHKSTGKMAYFMNHTI